MGNVHYARPADSAARLQGPTVCIDAFALCRSAKKGAKDAKAPSKMRSRMRWVALINCSQGEPGWASRHLSV